MRLESKGALTLVITIWWFIACCGKTTNAIPDCTKYIPYDSDSPICVRHIPEEDVLGLCYFFPSRPDLNYIIIDVDKLSRYDSAIEFTVMHEVLHCDHGLDHVPIEFLYDGCAKWIMGTNYPAQSTSNACFARHREYYKAQFEEAKSLPPTLFN